MYPEKIYEAMQNCAKRYNPKDPTTWAEKISYQIQAIQISDELEKMGYRLEQFRYTLQEDESVLVTDNGE